MYSTYKPVFSLGMEIQKISSGLILVQILGNILIISTIAFQASLVRDTTLRIYINAMINSNIS